MYMTIHFLTSQVKGFRSLTYMHISYFTSYLLIWNQKYWSLIFFWNTIIFYLSYKMFITCVIYLVFWIFCKVFWILLTVLLRNITKKFGFKENSFVKGLITKTSRGEYLETIILIMWLKLRVILRPRVCLLILITESKWLVFFFTWIVSIWPHSLLL